jgi:DNA-nicking Smr family endonuclease
MPYFDENPLGKIVFQAGDAEALLDLQGMPVEEAMQAVEKLLREPGLEKSFLIRFDAAADDGRETLFRPLGRRLLQARREGHLSRCLPTADGAGYFISFAD